MPEKPTSDVTAKRQERAEAILNEVQFSYKKDFCEDCTATMRGLLVFLLDWIDDTPGLEADFEFRPDRPPVAHNEDATLMLSTLRKRYNALPEEAHKTNQMIGAVLMHVCAIQQQGFEQYLLVNRLMRHKP